MQINKDEIISVLTELYKITGLRVSLHGADYGEIAAYPENMLDFCAELHRNSHEHECCLECDRAACARAQETRSTVIYNCRYGLVEAVSPLYNFGSLTGFLMMGQVLTEEDEGGVRELLREKFGELAEKIPGVPADMIPSYVNIMTICAKYLTLSNAMPAARPTLAKLAKSYIHENYGKKIGISDICDALLCSKTSLISSFRREFGTTVNSYITDLRLDEAKKMLTDANKSIGEIAHLVGFSDQSYFSKVFSSKFGITPSEYGKERTQ